MAFKFKATTKDEIPAPLADFYVEREGAFVLDVDGAAEKARLDEFRNTNVALAKERDEPLPVTILGPMINRWSSWSSTRGKSGWAGP